MNGLPPSNPIGLDCFRQLFEDYHERWEKQELVVQVADCDSKNRMEARDGRVFHFYPELFLQIQGTTVFTTPEQEVTVGPGQAAIVPAGVPHSEKIYDEETRKFGNLVVAFFNGNVSIHLAREVQPGVPALVERYLFQSDYFVPLVDNLELVASLHSTPAARAREAKMGILGGVFNLLLDIMSTDAVGEANDSVKVVESKWAISENLSNPDLSVAFLSERLGCNPNYLSRLFHQKTGEKLTDYITKTRLRNAMESLVETERSIKDVARICGFSDPNYFARVFRQYIGLSPHAYRKHEWSLLEKVRICCDPCEGCPPVNSDL